MPRGDGRAGPVKQGTTRHRKREIRYAQHARLMHGLARAVNRGFPILIPHVMAAPNSPSHGETNGRATHIFHH